MIFNVGDLYGGARYLYDSGNEKMAVSGGWEAFAPAWGGNTSAKVKGESSPSVKTNPIGCTMADDALEIWAMLDPQYQCFANGAWGTVGLQDISNYTTLHVVAERASSFGGHSYAVCGVTDSKTPPQDGTNTPPGTYADLQVGETTLDISGLSSGYVYIGGMSRSGVSIYQYDEWYDIRVTKIWLT